jgi:hypothetical protein
LLAEPQYRPAGKQLCLPPAGHAEIEKFGTPYGVGLSARDVSIGEGHPHQRRYRKGTSLMARLSAWTTQDGRLSMTCSGHLLSCRAAFWIAHSHDRGLQSRPQRFHPHRKTCRIEGRRHPDPACTPIAPVSPSRLKNWEQECRPKKLGFLSNSCCFPPSKSCVISIPPWQHRNTVPA